MVKLYNLLPAIIRARDQFVRESNAEGVVERIAWVMEQETDTQMDLIAGLSVLLDVDQCEPKYLLYLSALLGFPLGSDRGNSFRRWLTKNLVNLWKIKGTHPSWNKQFLWSLNRVIKAHELWKSEIYAEDDYSRDEQYDYGMLAARVDLYEEDEDGNRTYLPVTESTREVYEAVETFRPAHVLLRQYMTPFSIIDEEAAPTEQTTFSVGAVIEDADDEFTDEAEFTASCVGTCELACQEYCQTTCESAACEVWCETGCEVSCEYSCEVHCQSNCEIVCQAGCIYA